MQNPHYESDAQNWHIIGVELVSFKTTHLILLSWLFCLILVSFLNSSINLKGAHWSICAFTLNSHRRTGSNTTYETFKFTSKRWIDPIRLAQRPPRTSKAQKTNPNSIPSTSLSLRSRETWRTWKRIRISRASHSISERYLAQKETERSMQRWQGTTGLRRFPATSIMRMCVEPIYTTTCFTEF